MLGVRLRSPGPYTTWAMVTVCLITAALGYLALVVEPHRERMERIAELNQSAERSMRAADALMDRTCVGSVVFAIQRLQWSEAGKFSLDDEPSGSPAVRLAARLRSSERVDPRSGAGLPAIQVEVRGDNRLLWRDYDVSVLRISDDGEPQKVWAGDWLVLLVPTDRRRSPRSALGFTGRLESVWIRDEIVPIGDAAAVFDRSAPAVSLERAGWRGLPHIWSKDESGR